MVAVVGYQDISTIQYSYSEIVRMDLKSMPEMSAKIAEGNYDWNWTLSQHLQC